MLVRPGLILGIVRLNVCRNPSSSLSTMMLRDVRQHIVIGKQNLSLSTPLKSFHSSTSHRSNKLDTNDKGSIENAKTNPSSPDILTSYSAPLAKTFVRLKAFSLSSLAAAIALTPALLFAPADVGWSGRIGLSITALATSGASTAIFAWIGKPYVGSMRLLSAQRANDNVRKDVLEKIGEGNTTNTNKVDLNIAKPALQAQTTDWRLRKLQTTIYEPNLIRPTSRPLATWELTTKAPTLQENEKEKIDYPIIRLVAATRMEKDGKLVGRWWARWEAPSQVGKCSEEGNVIRHYSVHEELLGDDWRVL